MRRLLIALTSALLLSTTAQAKIVQFSASDGVTVTADFNTPNAAATTVIVLYHMAGASRGEYLKTAERLNALAMPRWPWINALAGSPME